MGRRRVLSSAQAQEIYDQTQRGVSRRLLAKQFAVSTQVVANIVVGRGYADVVKRTEHRHPDNCKSCQIGEVRDRNWDKARKFCGEVECESCRALVERTAGAVMNSHGRVLCDRCDRRRRGGE